MSDTASLTEHSNPSAADLLKGLALGAFAALIWGGYFAFSRAGVQAGLEPADVVLIRFAVAGLMMTPFLLQAGLRDLGGVGWGRGAVLALLIGPLSIFASVGGYTFAPMAHGTVIQPATVTVSALLLSAALLGETLRWGRVLGVALILLGLCAIAGPALWSGDAEALTGDALFVLAGLMWSGFTLFTRAWRLGPMQTVAAVSVLSAVVYTPWHLTMDTLERIAALSPWMLVGQVLVQGVLAGVVAILAFTRAVEILGAGRAGLFTSLVPACGVLIGIPLTGEAPTALQLAGLALVSFGLLWAMGILRLRRR
ncbi:MAG: DMT family transporter [Pseudomonadota bacterium]